MKNEGSKVLKRNLPIEEKMKLVVNNIIAINIANNHKS